MCTSVRMRRSNGWTYPSPDSSTYLPTSAELPRSRMRMMRPSSRFSSVLRSTRTSTRSPCIASLMLAAETYTSGGPFGGPVRNDEPEAPGVCLQPAHDEVHLVRQAHAIALGLDELAGLHERLDVAPEGDAFFCGNAQRAQQLARRGRMHRPSHASTSESALETA